MSDTDRPLHDPPIGRCATGSPAGLPVGGLIGVLIVGLVLGGCVGSGAPASTSSSGAAFSSPASPSVPASSAPDGASGFPALTTQTTTDWGRIWDALPRSFPVYPGAESVPDATGPSSERLTVPASVTSAVTWWRSALEAAGYSGVDAAKPLEDGSVVVDARAGGDCRIRVTIAPTGGTTTATILYGAACPFD